MIELKELSKFFGANKAIDEVTFKIEQGEIVGLLGPNGAGKTTILKVLGTYLVPSHGQALVGGFDTIEESDRVREIIGFLPDTPPLYGEMTVKDYLSFVARLKNVPAGRIAERVEYVIDRTNLQNMGSSPLFTLSHGFRQRVGIAQSLVHEPKVVILDEPMSGLDPIQIVEMRELIISLRNNHTVLLSSHLLSEITKTCDRILVIDRGKLVAEGAEDYLAQAVAQKQRIDVRFRGGNDGQIIAALRNVDGIAKVELVHQGDFSVLHVDAHTDMRPCIAKSIINLGADLYEIGKAEDGLESLFLKLVQNG